MSWLAGRKSGSSETLKKRRTQLGLELMEGRRLLSGTATASALSFETGSTSAETVAATVATTLAATETATTTSATTDEQTLADLASQSQPVTTTGVQTPTTPGKRQTLTGTRKGEVVSLGRTTSTDTSTPGGTKTTSGTSQTGTLGVGTSIGPTVTSRSADRTRPTIVSAAKTREGIVLTFSEPMDAARVSNPDNYVLQQSKEATKFKLTFPFYGKETEHSSLRVRTASYNPATRSVTLVPNTGVDPDAVYVVRSTNYTAPRGGRRDDGSQTLVDMAGNTLASSTRFPRAAEGAFRIRVSRNGR